MLFFTLLQTPKNNNIADYFRTLDAKNCITNTTKQTKKEINFYYAGIQQPVNEMFF